MGKKVFEDPNTIPTTPDPAIEVPGELQGKVTPDAYKLLQEEHLRELKEREDTLNQEYTKKLEDMNRNAVKSPAQNPPQLRQPFQAPQQQSPSSQQNADPNAFWNNPDHYLETKLDNRLQQVQHSNADIARSQNRVLFQMQNQEFYSDFGEQIEAVVDQFTPAVKGLPDAYQIAASYVRGMPDNSKKLLEKESKSAAANELKVFAEQAGIDPETVDTYLNSGQVDPIPQRRSLFAAPHVAQPKPKTPVTQKVKLTPAQAKVALAFGMSEDEYAELALSNTDAYSALKRGE